LGYFQPQGSNPTKGSFVLLRDLVVVGRTLFDDR
jgi:hypothetical protein